MHTVIMGPLAKHYAIVLNQLVLSRGDMNVPQNREATAVMTRRHSPPL